MKKLLVMTVAILFALSVGMAGCSPAEETMGESEVPSEEAAIEIEIGYVNWACATANTYLVKNILESEFGAEVTIRDMDAGLMWQSLGTGDLDLMVTAWLPGTHASYYDAVKDDVEDLGPLYEGAAIGLVVPTYVTIDSIEELNDNADKFEGKIIGIDAGAGIMTATDNALTEYDLSDFELLASGDAAMTAELSRAYENEEWVVVTGWAPHWKFAEFELKFLEDPKSVYGGEETINVITKGGFGDDNPEIKAFLENIFLSPGELGELIGIISDAEDKDAAAIQWIEDNRSLIDGWLA